MATEEMDRSGPIHAAVRGAGYNHEDELDSDSGAGSSVEEEDDELDDEDLSGQHTHAHYLAPHALHDDDHHDQRHHEEVPAYTRPPASSHIPIGPDGYAIEKKDKPLSGSADDRHRDIDLGPVPKAPAPVTLPSRHDSSDSESEGPAKTTSAVQAPPAQSKSPSTEDETASQSGILGRFKEVRLPLHISPFFCPLNIALLSSRFSSEALHVPQPDLRRMMSSLCVTLASIMTMYDVSESFALSL